MGYAYPVTFKLKFTTGYLPMWISTVTIALMTTLTDKQIRFAQEYCIDFNGTQAAIRAGYSENSAEQQACALLRNPRVKEAVEENKVQIANVAKLNAAWVLNQWMNIATADANDLVQLRRHCCRHCHGFAFGYQWTESEYSKAVDAAIEAGKPGPDLSGGFGYDMNEAPNPACPECGGLGNEYLFAQDTRKLKGNAKLLYAGVQKTKDGLKINMRDQDAALNNLAKFLGMHIERKEISGPNGGPVPLATLSADDLTDDQLAALVGRTDDDKPA